MVINPMPSHDTSPTPHKTPSLMCLLKPHRWLLVALISLTVLGNGLSLILPKIIARSIDTYQLTALVPPRYILWFALIALSIFVLTYAQNIVQTYISERVARDVRTELAAKISLQDHASIQALTPAKLLTNLTSDIDAVKTFVSQAVPSLVSSAFLILGISIVLLFLDWPLALAILGIVPLIMGTFFLVMGRVRKLFRRAQEAIDKLNKVINESILGSALIRLLNSQPHEYKKFVDANVEARDISLSILRLFASLIPIIVFTTNLATLIILSLGGYFVIHGRMSLGDFTAFNSYLAILIFPLIIIGFTSNIIAQAQASYQRVVDVLTREDKKRDGNVMAPSQGEITVEHVSLYADEKVILKDISFTAPVGSNVALIGPTAAGKTQLLYLLTGLTSPTQGQITYAGQPLQAYDSVSLHQRIGFVFQDSILFHLTLRENIAFSKTVTDEELRKALIASELIDFVQTLPQGLDTVVSERGTNLSGGQKQRIMLARALALQPSILLLDDFTARVDAQTEQTILRNIRAYYPHTTVISVTQKIAPVQAYDQIILLMEGEALAQGTHEHLMRHSPEYVQIFDSQRSTHAYELHSPSNT